MTTPGRFTTPRKSWGALVFHRGLSRQGGGRGLSCHNNHKDTPKRDFKLDDVMGGVVVRVALQP
jgi:hypothetical protein